MRRLAALVPCVLLAATAFAQTPAALKSIREADIKRDLFALGGDELRGREAGTIDEMRASVWVADEMERIGPLEKMLAVLNGDMLGRNHPDTAALMGSQPPHRNSADLVRMAIDANKATSKSVIDSSWDRPTHPEGWYFRSDHVPYAERNVPALFFSSNLHNDYHTPRDEPSAIDIAKLTRITQWMYMTGWLAANGKRPAVDSGFVLR